MNLDNSKYISETKSGKWRVCFPESIKKPRRLGVFETFVIAQQKRDKWLKDNGFISDSKSLRDKPDDSKSMLELWQENQEQLESKPSWQDLIEYAKQGTKIQGAYRPAIKRATRRIITDKPVLVCNASDFHLGSPHTDYDAFLKTTDLIVNNDIYLNIVGADLESAFTWFKNAETVTNQVLPPWLQVELYKQWLDQMFPKTLAVCSDNHSDLRLERYLGDIGLIWRDDVPYFRAWGILTLEIGPDENNLAKYEFVISHKYKGSSTYHDLQPALRMMRDIYPLADVYITAHTHKPAYMNGCFYPEARLTKPRQHFIVCGTFKNQGDLYSLRNFGSDGVIGLPTLALWPGQYKIAYFDNPETAAELV